MSNRLWLINIKNDLIVDDNNKYNDKIWYIIWD
jgi:hypothetical protein